MVLFVLKMNRDAEKNITKAKVKETSFAYKFNKKYREQVDTQGRKLFTTKVGMSPKDKFKKD